MNFSGVLEFRSPLEADCVMIGAMRDPVCLQMHHPDWPTGGAVTLHMTLKAVI